MSSFGGHCGVLVVDFQRTLTLEFREQYAHQMSRKNDYLDYH